MKMMIINCIYTYTMKNVIGPIQIFDDDKDANLLLIIMSQQQGGGDRRSLVQQTDEYKANLPGQNDSDSIKVMLI